jgi:hypothetical protein
VVAAAIVADATLIASAATVASSVTTTGDHSIRRLEFYS